MARAQILSLEGRNISGYPLPSDYHLLNEYMMREYGISIDDAREFLGHETTEYLKGKFGDWIKKQVNNIQSHYDKKRDAEAKSLAMKEFQMMKAQQGKNPLQNPLVIGGAALALILLLRK